jgi:hypothetical protein
MDRSVRIDTHPTNEVSPVIGPKGLVLLCGYCRKELHEWEMHEFRDWVACEACIRDYLRDRPVDIEREVAARRQSARTWLAKNRKTLEREAVKK